MKCIAKNTKKERCKNKGELKRLFFCKHHSILSSEWYFFKSKKYQTPIVLIGTLISFFLIAIVTWEIEEAWSKSLFRKCVYEKEGNEEPVKILFSTEENFNILLIPFGSSQSCNDETVLCERELKNFFYTQSKISDSKIEVKIDSSIEDRNKIFSKNELEQLGKRVKADLILWGDYSKRCGI